MQKVEVERVMMKKPEPMHFELADWFYKSKDGEVLGYDDIKQEIINIRRRHERWSTRHDDIWPEDIHHWCAKARERLESYSQCTIICIPKVGYRIATVREATRMGMQRFHKLFLLEQACQRIMPLMDRKFVWADFQEVFSRAEKETIRLNGLAKKFLTGYQHEVKQEQKEKEKKDGKKAKGLGAKARQSRQLVAAGHGA